MRLHSNAGQQTSPASKTIRPSDWYEYELLNRQYGGEEKERRAAERKQQATLRAQGISTGPGMSTTFDSSCRNAAVASSYPRPGMSSSRRAYLNRSRIDETHSKPSLRSWNDVAQNTYQRQPMTSCTSQSPLGHGPSTLKDANNTEAECATRTRQISADSTCIDSDKHHQEAASVDHHKVEVQLHIAKFGFDATDYGDSCLSLVPGDVLECIGHEQDGWIQGRRWPHQREAGTNVGVVEEGWCPAEFVEPWSENTHVDARGSVDVGMDSCCAVALTDERLVAATEKACEATSLELAVYSFDGSQFGQDYMSLDVGDVVVFDGCEVDGWLLGRCISSLVHHTVLRRGWYPRGFTQPVSEPDHAAVNEPQSIDPDVSRTLRSWNEVAQNRRKNWWVSSGSGVLRGVSPSLGEGTACDRSKAAGAIAFQEQGSTHVRLDLPIVEPSSGLSAASQTTDGSAGVADKGNKGVTRAGDLAVQELTEEPDAEQPPAPADQGPAELGL